MNKAFPPRLASASDIVRDPVRLINIWCRRRELALPDLNALEATGAREVNDEVESALDDMLGLIEEEEEVSIGGLT